LPHEHFTFISAYFGWMSVFMMRSNEKSDG